MYKFSDSGKDIARGDDMKKPNKFFAKKYISSLVIAAFLVLSVLTAYNIKTGKEGPEASNTEVKETEGEKVKETIGDSDDVITSGERQLEEREDTMDSEKDKEEDDTSRNKEDDEQEQSDVIDSEQEEAKEDSKKSTDETAAETKQYNYNGKNNLTWPLIGNIILPYSMDTTVYYTTLDQYACNDGILIGGKTGDEVVAVADGRVVNVFDSDRYGKTVTLLIGDYYEVSYGQVENVKYDIGDEVEEGDVLATVAEPARAFSLEGPHLYFKMTYKGEPVNPTDYLKS